MISLEKSIVPAQGISTGEGKLNINFVLFELKLSRGADKAMGRISRYMGWVKRNLATDKKVGGVTVAREVDENLKYAASIVLDINLFEYELHFKIRPVSIDD